MGGRTWMFQVLRLVLPAPAIPRSEGNQQTEFYLLKLRLVSNSARREEQFVLIDNCYDFGYHLPPPKLGRNILPNFVFLSTLPLARNILTSSASPFAP